MEPIEVIITVVVGLFGLSYPVLLQIVSGLDDRYESTKITE